MKQNIYRLKSKLATSKSWQLPLKKFLIEKIIEKDGSTISLGPRKVVYVPGANSIFREDIQGDLKPESIWFENGELRVPESDILLNTLLKKHALYGQMFELWSQDKEDEKRLEIQRAKASARQLIDDADFDKVKSIALAVFGPVAINWSDTKCELELREYADTKPKKLKAIMDEKDYSAKQLAALAFVKGITKVNEGKTAVIWSDSEGVIVKLAKGENGIKELGRYLSVANEESTTVLQSIGERLEALDTGTEKIGNESDLEKENAELRAKLEALQPKNSAPKDDKSLNEIQQARADYKAKFQKDVPPNMKNKLDWILNKLGEA